MFHQEMAYRICQQDAVRVFVSRLADWARRQMFSVDDAITEADRAYRIGWNAAMAQLCRHLLGS